MAAKPTAKKGAWHLFWWRPNTHRQFGAGAGRIKAKGRNGGAAEQICCAQRAAPCRYRFGLYQNDPQYFASVA